MKVNRKVKMDLIISHLENQQWFKDEVAAIEEQNRIDLEKVRIMQDRRGEWNSGSPADKRRKYAEILASLEVS